MAPLKHHLHFRTVLAALMVTFLSHGHAADVRAPMISGHATTGPGGWDLTVSPPTSDAPLGYVQVDGGVTGPVIEVVPPGDGQDCWCLNVKRTDTDPASGDQRTNLYIRDSGDGITIFDQFSLISSIGGNCNSFPTPRLGAFVEGDFKVTTNPDFDGDGVLDDQDECPDTPAGTVVNSRGCSIDQLVPCVGPAGGGTWYSHAQYVAAIAKAAQAFYVARLITLRERNEIIRDAAKNDCGMNARERRLVNRPLQFRTQRGQR